MAMSEDQLFKAILKKKPEARVAVKKEPALAPQPLVVHEEKKPVVETPAVRPLDTEHIIEEIKNLTASMNMIYGLIKTVIVPVLVLILIMEIAIAVLVRIR